MVIALKGTDSTDIVFKELAAVVLIPTFEELVPG